MVAIINGIQSPPNSHTDVLTYRTVECTLVGNGITTGIKQRRDPSSGMAAGYMGRNTMGRYGQGSGWCHRSQETKRVPATAQAPGKRRPSQPSGHLVLGLLLQNCEGIHIWDLSSPVCGSWSQKPSKLTVVKTIYGLIETNNRKYKSK